MTTSPEATVRALLDHLAARDADAALALLAEDVEWRNSGLPTIRGARVHSAIRDLVRRGVTFEVRLHRVTAVGDVVLTDRTDVLGYGGWTAELDVRGRFEVREGRIVAWHDSFSWREAAGSGLARLASVGLDLLRRSR
jgi:limonene-1,2-epoxide hydrolase